MQMTRDAQAEQRRLLAEQTRRVEAVEAGQRRLIRGGGGGLLAFLGAEDEEPIGGDGATLGATRTRQRSLVAA
jgi:hypothetical protein